MTTRTCPPRRWPPAGATADPVKDYLKQIGKVPLLNAGQEVELAKRIEAGLFADHKLAEGSGVLRPGQSIDLERVAEDGRRAKNHLLEANLQLVISLTKQDTEPGMLFLNMIQEGNLDLIRAVEKVDTKKLSNFLHLHLVKSNAIATRSPNQARTIRYPCHRQGHQQAGPGAAADAAGPRPGGPSPGSSRPSWT